jgi:hypothetical protein
MKKVLKTEMPISYGNFVWRLIAPFIILELIGISLDRTFHFHKLFKVAFAVISLGITMWGLYVTAKDAEAAKEYENL